MANNVLICRYEITRSLITLSGTAGDNTSKVRGYAYTLK